MSSFTNVGQMSDELFDEIEAIHAAEDAGVDYWGTNAAEEAAKEVVQERIENPQPIVEKVATVSKKELAIAVFNSLEDKRRKAVISALVEVGFKASTASTYQANLKKWA